MKTSRSERIEEAARAVIDHLVVGDAVYLGARVPVAKVDTLRAALALREEEPIAVPRSPRDAVERSALTDDGPSCGASDPGGSPSCCTRKRGHDGDHAHGNLTGRILARWPQPAPAKAEDWRVWSRIPEGCAGWRTDAPSPGTWPTKAACEAALEEWHGGPKWRRYYEAREYTAPEQIAQPAPAKGERWGIWLRRADVSHWYGGQGEPWTYDARAAAEAVTRNAWWADHYGALGFAWSVRPYPATSTPAPLPAAASEGRVVVGFVIRWREDDLWLRSVVVDDAGEWTGARWADESSTAKPTRWTAADVERARVFWPLGYGAKHPFRVFTVTRRVRAK